MMEVFGKRFSIARAKNAVASLKDRRAEAKETLRELEDLETILNGLWSSLDETLDEIDRVGLLIQDAVKEARTKAAERKEQLNKIFGDQ